ncbi:MAG: excinuclease ABC subunit UvrA [Candidatus Diapherotrites archaeon]|uniref:UvrABC system protein A n=1 Tax=Candidatus Iainarchaeum sp. TaxID=3101447 RepID=A0A8T4L7T4_9ARCH|nr:excinuclease ABC subunit UvrA [Candidatus Diapherotrites archaeon]
MDDFIRLRGCREHNLKNISLDLPRNKLIVITGVSGSGKSTLAFDTLYAEGQRRYVESLSAYARQFLGLMNKPDVDSIEGLSPAISIEQKSTSKNPRSTVGTITEIFDYLRLLYARIGTPHCPVCGKVLSSTSTDAIVDSIFKQYASQPIQVMAPIVRQKKGTYEKMVEDLGKKGFARFFIDGFSYSAGDKLDLDKQKKHSIDVVVDRLAVLKENQSRIADAIETAAGLANGFVVVKSGKDSKSYSKKLSCDEHEISFEELQPRMFSFNSPFGACDECHGIGYKQEFDPDLVIPDKTVSILKGAIALPGFGSLTGWRGQQLASLARHFKFSLNVSWNQLSKQYQKIILYGSDEPVKFEYNSVNTDSSFSGTTRFEGIIPLQKRLYTETKSERRRQDMEEFMRVQTCETCKGHRLKPLSLAVTVGEKNVIEVSDLTVLDLVDFFKNLDLSKKDFEISRQVLKEIRDRLFFIRNVGLGYLTLSRPAATLSGGESQRIRLATQIGSNLTGVMYILDEPSIGLHQRDNQRLIETLQRLRDLGNTVLVVEHDDDTIRQADFVIDIGPGAGIHGGFVVATGTPAEIEANPKSLTGKFLSGKEKIPVPKTRRKSEKKLVLFGCKEHNLKNIDVEFPLGVMTCITGVSGSGKSSLINDTLFPLLSNRLNHSDLKVGLFSKLTGLDQIDKVININQQPIGRTPRSNPGTYIGVFDLVRDLYASTREAKIRGFGPGRFSFNVPGGRCEACEGNGSNTIEMNFLPDVTVVCEECKGTRFNRETLSITYKGKNVSDVLNMSVEEAVVFFENIPRIRNKLALLADVGLNYIKMGQSATTLSGGEAQRVKIAKELSKRETGSTIYLLDEPTTGLHFADVKKLLEVLNRLIASRNTVIIVEHNLDVIKSADYIIDLGPEGGLGGGQIIAKGTPEDVTANSKSYTGQFLKQTLSPKEKNVSSPINEKTD